MEEKEMRPQENKMGVLPVNKLLVSMSVPIMLSMLVQALYNIVDSVFVSRLSENALIVMLGSLVIGSPFIVHQS